MLPVLVIDFGSQVTQLIVRRIRESVVYCEVVPFNQAEAALQRNPPQAIIFSGGPASVCDKGSPRAPESVFKLGVPVLGICYGQQTMVAQLGGRVEPHTKREFGRAEIEVTGQSPLLDGVWALGARDDVWMSHGDRVTQLPPGFHVIGTSDNAPFAIIADEKRRFYAVMFHPEVVHTPRGGALLRNFTQNVAGIAPNWNMKPFRAEAIRRIREQVGQGRVICGLSGGVDSSVAALLIHEAIGDQLTCIFVDTGLMRAGEADEVVSLFRGHYNIPLIHADAAELFLSRLDGVDDPERKRKVIGAAFIDVFEAEAKKVGNAEFLAQGTLYPDVIESVSALGGPSATIKSHHNVGGLPDRMHLKLVAPLRELFKDEVRALGTELGLPKAFVGRHPFPGPGLAVRIMGEITPEGVRMLQEADDILVSEIKKAGLYRQIWQSFGVLLPVKSVGVMGDIRTYEHTLAIRAVHSNDGMTADWVRLPYDLMAVISNRIVNEVKGINRVVYDITSKPPATIEWE